MAVSLTQTNLASADTQEFQRNVTDAVKALSDERLPALGVLFVSASRKLVGNEDVVLVDASTSTTEIALILPGTKLLRRSLTVKVRKAGPQAVRIKATDIPSGVTPSIDGEASIAIPAGETGSRVIVTDGLNYFTVN